MTLFRFGTARVDVDQRQLIRDGRERFVSPKAFQLLNVLLRARPAVLTKEQLMAQVWPDAFVSDANLAVLIGELRAAIGDSARSPHFIKTHHGVGYSFIGEVNEVSRSSVYSNGPMFLLLIGERRIMLGRGELTVGRDDPCDVALKHPSVSRQHARLIVDGTTLTVEDLNSKNGTRVNGHRIAGPTEVSDGQQIVFGKVEATVVLQRSSGGTTMTVIDTD